MHSPQQKKGNDSNGPDITTLIIRATDNLGSDRIWGTNRFMMNLAKLEMFGKTKEVTYVSTGGGATLELLAGDTLPGVAAISDME